MPKKRVLSIGQCAADDFRITQMLREHFDAEVIMAATEDEALASLRQGSYDLILVNRILDANGTSGLSLISQIQTSLDHPPPIMLVTNYSEFQQEAEQLGAVPGFGKGSLYAQETVERLAKYLR